MTPIIFKGFSVTLSLILAIGAQNAFVLKQGLKKEYIFSIVLLCIFIDIILISSGVFGIGYFISNNPFLINIIAIIGIVFLTFYGITCLKSAFKNEHMNIEKEERKKTFKETIILVLVFSLLNPHTYLDTILLIGGIGASYSLINEKLFFLLGSFMASTLWFISLGFGSRILTPIFQKSITWKILDVGIAVMMFYIAYSLTKLFT